MGMIDMGFGMCAEHFDRFLLRNVVEDTQMMNILYGSRYQADVRGVDGIGLAMPASADIAVVWEGNLSNTVPPPAYLTVPFFVQKIPAHRDAYP